MKKILWMLLIGFYFSQLSFANTTHHHATSKHKVAKVQSVKPNPKSAKKSHTSSNVHQKKSKKKLHNKKTVATKRPAIPNDRTDFISQEQVMANQAKPASSGFIWSMEKRLVSFVHKTVSNLRYSSYKLGGTNFDPARGVYVLDCSDYVDKLLKQAEPNAYWNLVDSTGAEKPTTAHYYDFFKQLPNSGSSQYWRKVSDVEQLQAGDILVFRYQHAGGGGHVMIVMDKPIYDQDAYLVRVADSARTGHSEDTRPGHASGIGIGTLLLKAHPQTGAPTAFAWTVNSSWKSNVRIAMARPTEGSSFFN